jgi:RNase H-fold protein (predicted Holliday junction resolvase)
MFTERVEKTFGRPKAVSIAVGDKEQQKHWKYKEQGEGEEMRDVLRRAGYEVVLVDECRTTAACSGASKKTQNARKREKKGGKSAVCWCAKHAASCGRGTTMQQETQHRQ